MTKKKMRKLIILGVMIFYVASLLMVLFTSRNSIGTSFNNNFGNPVYTDQMDWLEKFKKDYIAVFGE